MFAVKRWNSNLPLPYEIQLSVPYQGARRMVKGYVSDNGYSEVKVVYSIDGHLFSMVLPRKAIAGAANGTTFTVLTC